MSADNDVTAVSPVNNLSGPTRSITKGSTRPRVKQMFAWGAWMLALVVLVVAQGEKFGGPVAPGEADVERFVVSATTAGVVERITVRRGDAVRKDMIVVEMVASTLDREIEAARHELVRLESEIPARRLDISEGARLDEERRERTAVDARLASLRLAAEYERDRATLVSLESNIARQRELVAKKLASQEALDELLLRHAELKETVAQGKAVSESASKAADVAERAYSKRTKTSNGASSLDDRLGPLEAAIIAHKEEMKNLDELKAGLTVAAHIDGNVLDVFVVPGDAVELGEPLLGLVQSGTRRVTVFADEAWARSVAIDDTASLAPSDGQGTARTGRVVGLSAAIAETPPRFRLIPTQPSFSRAVFVELDHDQGVVLPGQAFDVVFSTATTSSVTISGISK